MLLERRKVIISEIISRCKDLNRKIGRSHILGARKRLHGKMNELSGFAFDIQQ